MNVVLNYLLQVCFVPIIYAQIGLRMCNEVILMSVFVVSLTIYAVTQMMPILLKTALRLVVSVWVFGLLFACRLAMVRQTGTMLGGFWLTEPTLETDWWIANLLGFIFLTSLSCGLVFGIFFGRGGGKNEQSV